LKRVYIIETNGKNKQVYGIKCKRESKAKGKKRNYRYMRGRMTAG